MPYGNRTETVAKPWDFRLSRVYCIAVLDYALNGSTTAVNRNRIRNDQPPHTPFSDKLQFVTLELPLFDETKPEYKLDRRVNKWLFFLKYLPYLKDIPDFFKGDEVFEKAFEVARYAKLTRKERRRYELNIKRMRDTYAVIVGNSEIAYNKGYDEGRIEESQNSLRSTFSQKLGPIPPEIDEAIRGLNDIAQIRRILAQFTSINDWHNLRNHLPKLDEGNHA